MRALVLEGKGRLSLREFDIRETMGPRDVEIAIRNVGVCGSDVHYYEHGSIGPFVVEEPMILGHEASGTVVRVGSEVETLRPGDRVCMEPGIPDPNSRASRLGMYNLDPAVRFWATPPYHGVMRPTVVHPADYTFKLPDNVSFAEGAMVEPLAVGMHAAAKARIKPGDLAVVLGAGTIGTVTALAALAGGCSTVLVTDILQPKLDVVAGYPGIVPVNVAEEDAKAVVDAMTGGWGADIVFEASGAQAAIDQVFGLSRPGGTAVFIGMPVGPARIDIVAAQAKEVRMETIFRYAHVYPRALSLMGSGKIDLRPLVTETFEFDRSLEAYDYALHPDPSSVKVQVVVSE